MKKFVTAVAILGALHSQAQSPVANLSFEVATIKLNPACQPGRERGGTSPGRLDLPCMSVRALIRIAYGAFSGENMASRRVEALGGPAWLDSDRYDLSAKAEGAATPAQLIGPMLQRLLEERFKVAIHKESKEAPVYLLTIAKPNPGLARTKEGSCLPLDLNRSRDALPGIAGPKYCGTGQGRGFSGQRGMAWDWYGVTMEEFAGRMLEGNVDRPVINKTGLAGQFDLHLEFAPEIPAGPVLINGVATPAPPSIAESTLPSIFAGLQEQLGLKLVPSTGPVEVIVVDHAEKPSAN